MQPAPGGLSEVPSLRPAAMPDRVRDYLKSRRYADHVVRRGLGGLVENWERTASSVAERKPSYLYYYEYLNDMDGRRILQEALEVASAEARAQFAPRVEEADRVIRKHLVPTDNSICSKKSTERGGYNRERDWWYYHRPQDVEAFGWPKDAM